MDNTPMKILIPNATGPTNLGDEAMLEVVLNLLHKIHPKAQIIIQSSDPHLYKNSPYTHRANLFYHSMFEKKDILSRVYRTSLIVFNLLRAWLFDWKPSNTSTTINKIIKDYYDSDLIVFVGHGYLRSQNGLRQFLNLVMLSLRYFFSKVSGTRTILMPMSFGPYASKLQERFAAKFVFLADVVSVREKISYEVLKKYDTENKLLLSTDLAVLTPKAKPSVKNTKNLLVGITLRDWLQSDRQEKFEANVFEAIRELSQKNPITILPIVQVFGEEYGTIDYQIMDLLKKRCLEAGIDCLDVRTIQVVFEASSVYASLDLLIGMRMHSNIIAAAQHTPFVAIAYEYKTQGIAHAMGMDKYVVDVETVTKNKLTQLIQKALVSRKDTHKHLSKQIPKMQKDLLDTWTNILK